VHGREDEEKSREKKGGGHVLDYRLQERREQTKETSGVSIYICVCVCCMIVITEEIR